MRRERNKREEGGNRKGNWKERSCYKKKIIHAVDFSKMGEFLLYVCFDIRLQARRRSLRRAICPSAAIT